MATINIEMADKDMKELLELKIYARKGRSNKETKERVKEIEASIIHKVLGDYYYERGEET